MNNVYNNIGYSLSKLSLNDDSKVFRYDEKNCIYWSCNCCINWFWNVSSISHLKYSKIDLSVHVFPRLGLYGHRYYGPDKVGNIIPLNTNSINLHESMVNDIPDDLIFQKIEEIIYNLDMIWVVRKEWRLWK